jgi:serine protease inhibitor
MHESVNAANTEFAFDLFDALAEVDSGENVFISPLSVSIALAMAYNGASGETQQAMAETLGISGLSLKELNEGSAALLASLQNVDPNVKLAIANSLWARQGFVFSEDFLERNRQFFGAEVSTLDFNDPASVGVINGWVSENTNGKIDKILDSINPMDVLFLINAIYFNGQWTVEFDESKTQDRAFHLLDGSEKQYPMMMQSGRYQYLDGEGFQAVSLPYGENERMSMYIFLPDAGSSLADFMEGLNAESWNSWLEQFENKEGDVGIPRFKTEYELTLNDTLKALGMEPAFDPNAADFAAMSDEQVYISQVRHKAVVEVNEQGTEAAAVTSVGVSVTSAFPQPERFSLIADRPFFYAIQDSETGSVLFMGTLTEPQE